MSRYRYMLKCSLKHIARLFVDVFFIQASSLLVNQHHHIKINKQQLTPCKLRRKYTPAASQLHHSHCSSTREMATHNLRTLFRRCTANNIVRRFLIPTLNSTGASTTTTQQFRPFFGYFRIAFNSVDKDRLLEVGPDRLCAEWLLKNGGAITFVGRRSVEDYNALGSAGQRHPIESVEATDASIMAIGFDHFRNCRALQRITLTRCKHMENEALQRLTVIKDSLRELTLTDCFNVTDSGLVNLGELSGLQKLNVSGVPYVKDLPAVRATLAQKLPECEIIINP